MSEITGEAYGIKWSIDEATVQKLKESGIDAIAEIQKALDNHNATLPLTESKSNEH